MLNVLGAASGPTGILTIDGSFAGGLSLQSGAKVVLGTTGTNAIAVSGGVTVGAFDLGIPPQMYIARMHDTIEVKHFLVGLSKAPVFALVIGLIGCLEGLRVEGTAQSVGERTTSSVVQAISLVIMIDALAALWFMHMDW